MCGICQMHITHITHEKKPTKIRCCTILHWCSTGAKFRLSPLYYSRNVYFCGMEAKDFRIGNLFSNHVSGENVFKVKLISDRFLQSENRSHSYENVFGIPLSDEWLEKAEQFRKGIQGEYWSELTSEINIELNKSAVGYEVSISVSDPTETASATLRTIKYVHELQNICYDLGQEPTLSEKATV